MFSRANLVASCTNNVSEIVLLLEICIQVSFYYSKPRFGPQN